MISNRRELVARLKEFQPRIKTLVKRGNEALADGRAARNPIQMALSFTESMKVDLEVQELRKEMYALAADIIDPGLRRQYLEALAEVRF